MESNLSLKEKLILLALHPDKGSGLAQSYLGYGIAGAMLLELANLKKITIEDKKVKLVDHKKTGDRQLDYLIDILIGAGKPLRVKGLVFKLQSKTKAIRKPLVEGLVKKHYLKSVEKRFLSIKYYQYPSANISYRKDLIEHIRRLVLREIPSDDHDIPLLTGLAGACRFAQGFFHGREERKKAAGRIKVIIKESPVDKAIDETIKAVQAAIMAAIATSVVVTTTSR